MNADTCIYRGKNLVEIELIKSKLDDANIPYLVRTNDASGTLPHISDERGTEILIPSARKADAEKALMDK